MEGEIEKRKKANQPSLNHNREKAEELADQLLLVPEHENVMQNQREKQKTKNNEGSAHLLNVYYEFPFGINFRIALVDAQHT